MKKLIIQIIKFGIVGVIATVIDFAFLFVFNDLLHFDTLFTYGGSVSNALSFLISLVFNFLLSMKFVFKAKDGLSKGKQIVIFFVTSVIGFIINELAVFIFADNLKLNIYIVKVAATVIVMIWNFVSKKLLLENNKKNRPDENTSN